MCSLSPTESLRIKRIVLVGQHTAVQKFVGELGRDKAEVLAFRKTLRWWGMRKGQKHQGEEEVCGGFCLEIVSSWSVDWTQLCKI
jgi:hypothetical protein